MSTTQKGKLFLVPTTLGDEGIQAIPPDIPEVLRDIKVIIAEKEKTARRYLKALGLNPGGDRDFLPLDKHVSPMEKRNYLAAALEGENIALLSEAGCPGVADPGAEIVLLAHRQEIQVVPMTGPSSILLALMASGMSGQQFAFHGYLPRDQNQRIKKLRDLEKESGQLQQSQIFIETPYRNEAMFADILRSCRPETQLCVAADITLPTEYIRTYTIDGWKKKRPELQKRPAVFILFVD